MNAAEHLDVAVIGGGQSGLAMGYYLARQGLRFAIFDAGARVGDSWRERWDSLRFITPCPYNSLPGLPFPAPAWSFPHKDDVVRYLSDYADKFRLPVRHGQRVTRLAASGEGYRLEMTGASITASTVVIATGAFQHPVRPDFTDASSDLLQLHSAEYRNPAQIAGQRVLIVGCGNSGAGIAQDLASTHRVTLALGRTASSPRQILGRDFFWWAHLFGVTRITAESRLGKRLRRGPDGIIGTSPERLAAERGITIAPRVVGLDGARARFIDGTEESFDAIIWATGFNPRYDWIDLPGFDGGRPNHLRGVTRIPGLYFLGLKWQHTIDSSLLGGVGRDATYLAEHIAFHLAGRDPAAARSPR